MARYPHYVIAPKRKIWPELIVAVDCVSTCQDVGDSRLGTADVLDSWHAITFRLHETGYVPVKTMLGMDARSFWNGLTKYGNRPGCIWIMSYLCNRNWSLLDLWGRMESNEIVLTQTDQRSPQDIPAARGQGNSSVEGIYSPQSAGAERAIIARQSGYLVCEDPPNIIRCRVQGSQSEYQWVDTRNYGVECEEHVPRGRETCRWIGNVIREVHNLSWHKPIGGLMTTAGSQAMHAWRSEYLTHAVYCHNHPEALEIEDKSYVGGRCEAFNVGEIAEPVTVLDFRSMYPSICIDCHVPTRLMSVHIGDYGQLSRALLDPSCMIADVLIETDEPAYPFRRKDDVIWPVGTFRTVLAGPELQDALEHNRIRDVYRYAVYAMEPALHDYAVAMMELRVMAENQPVHGVADLIKRLLVGLPGKFGQRDRRWVDAPGVSYYQPYGQWWGCAQDGTPCRYRSISGRVQQDAICGFSIDAVPAIASWITSAARMRLLNAIRIAGWSNVYYIDTDSLFTSTQGYANLEKAGIIDRGVVGKLQVKQFHATLKIIGIKSYNVDGRVVCAGLPKGHCVDAGDGTHYWHYRTAIENIKQGIKPDAQKELRQYVRTGEYSHGVVGHDGKVSPHRIGVA